MKKLKQLTAVLLAFLLMGNLSAFACTRVVYKGPNGMVITARSMDWKDKIPANLWIFPRGTERNGQVGPNSIKWVSKYGSVVTSTWDIVTADGMNEKGLVANMLWLANSEYPAFDVNGNKKGLAISLWLQYVLDNFASVDETVKELEKEEFTVVSDLIPGTDKFTTLHLSISDASGDNAVFEYIDGKLEIHHDKSYTVMTNEPIFEEQLAINQYWKNIPGTIMLPGTNRASDRIVRASYYIDAIPQTDDKQVATASVFSVIRNCSVPFGISSTRWRTVADQKNMVYYFENVLSPNVISVEFTKLDFTKGAPVKKLALANNENYCGESSENFQIAEPMVFASLSN